MRRLGYLSGIGTSASDRRKDTGRSAGVVSIRRAGDAITAARHRGGAVPGFPENCIATFNHTLEHTFSILEIDLRLTKDGHIVLHHDSDLDRTTTGHGPIADRTLSELKQLRLRDSDGNVTDDRIPTIEEVFQWARGTTILILDKKAVPVELCVKKIQEHDAQAFAMVMAYSMQEIQTCHQLDPSIMMEVMIGNQQRLREFDRASVPWNRVIAFVGHGEPTDSDLLKQIHTRGSCCMAGTSRNLDPLLRVAADGDRGDLKVQYQNRLDFGVDIIETDLPVQVGALLYDPATIPSSKARFFHVPSATDTP